jgi:hypothetical protein
MRKLVLPSNYANSVGVVIDIMSKIDFDLCDGTEKVGAVLVDSNGIAQYNPPRNSRYKLIFRGLPAIFDDVGDNIRWLQYQDNVILDAPVLSEIRDTDIVRDYGINKVFLNWKYSSNINCRYDVIMFVVANNAEEIVAQDIVVDNIIIQTKQVGEVLFYVQIKSMSGIYGGKSNKVSVTLPPIQNNKFIVGNNVSNEFVLVHNLDTIIITPRCFFVDTEEELQYDYKYLILDNNTIKISFDFVPTYSSIMILLDKKLQPDIMSQLVYDKNKDGKVDNAEVADTTLNINEDLIIDAGQW